MPDLHIDAIVPLTGSAFEVCEHPGGTFTLTLTKVVPHVKTIRQEAFSLFFRGPAEIFLPQKIYKLREASLGELEIFLVPVAREEDGFHYEAVFNHIFSGL